MNCAVRAVLYREHSVWYSKQMFLSKPHNTAYKAEWTERELGLTVVLNVGVVNIFMGKQIVKTQSKQRMPVIVNVVLLC